MHEPHPLYPMYVRLGGVPCLVVGGGPVAARKARGLADCGAAVTVVAPEIGSEVRALDVAVERRAYRAGEAGDYRLVCTAADDPAVNARVFTDAEAAGVPVNSADDPAHCRFVLPAVARRGPLAVAVSTSGHSPALASWLRDQLAGTLGPEHEVLAGVLEEAREALQRAGERTEGRDWRRALDSGMLDLIREGRVDEAREHLHSCL